ncbi:MAG: hypothetical protein ACD_45C00650G0002 [uncultured bacterium]|nr:MAG: hypothetical protein ACD_45C00650G0002 [uncultured bacterium]
MQADQPIITGLQKELSSDKHQKDLSKLKRKRWLICASLPIALFSGIGFGFATASALNTAFIGLSIASAGFVWPLAILACIGYVFLIYHTVSDMIANDTITTWKKRVSGWFKRQGTQDRPEKTLVYALRVTGIGLLTLSILSISVLATLATAGTWWLAVKEGALLIPRIATGAIIIRDFLIPLTFITGLAFSIRNSLLSVRLIMQKICGAHPLQYLASQYRSVFKKEGLVVRLNPFKLLVQVIIQPIKASIFIGHLIATGLTGDRTPCLNQGAAIASAAIGALSDGLVDYSYITAKEECDEETDNAHHDDAKHHHHDHAPFIDWVLKFALSPLHLLAATWDYFFTQKPFGALFKKHLEYEPHEHPHIEWTLHHIVSPLLCGFAAAWGACFTQKTFRALYKSYQYQAHTHDHDHPDIKTSGASPGWIQQELRQRFEKHMQHAKTEEEKTTLRTSQALLSTALSTENKTVPNMSSAFFDKKSQHGAAEKWITQIASEYQVML